MPMMGYLVIVETEDLLKAMELCRWALKNDEKKIGALDDVASCKRLNDAAIDAINFLNMRKEK